MPGVQVDCFFLELALGLLTLRLAAKNGNLKTKYLPEQFVKMQIGGVSTGGISNTITLNKEVLRACAENGIYTNILMIMSKYASKILQFIRI